MKITKPNGQTTSEAGVLMDYFGKKEGQTLNGFMDEVKALGPNSKTELATLAAKALGYSVDDSISV